MSYSPSLSSSITNTKMRTPQNVSPLSGMCAVCSSNCPGPCEIGLSALRGPDAIYPYKADINQFASEKDYPLDFSCFNINGRVFGVSGTRETPEEATYPKADITAHIGKIPVTAPIILPAMAKLNWQDYYAGAALYGIPVVIGEDVVAKDPGLELHNGVVTKSPLIREMVETFRKYYRGYGDIVLQANPDDENLGVLDYAITKLGVKSVELKFGQAAKGIQGMGPVKTLEDALKFDEMGYLILPDPKNPEVVAAHKKGIGEPFMKIGKLPLWDEAHLIGRVQELRDLGAEQIFFKTGPFNPADLMKILLIASKARVDLVTFDGAGGGSGNSPTKMMNEWGIPTVEMGNLLVQIMKKMADKGYPLPDVALAGGLAMEDDVYKALALGAPYIKFVGIGRAAMAAAFVGKSVGDSIREHTLSKSHLAYGDTAGEIFNQMPVLASYYGDQTGELPLGAVGVYSYLRRVETGLKQFMALNRHFTLETIRREDLVPLTESAAKATGLKTFSEMALEAMDTL
ncbi:MAG: glutamate synthase [delta proteobacterium ML8_F1]|nr:MAG: glutamate synthase [delta proteobacterium ML8_F1]